MPAASSYVLKLSFVGYESKLGSGLDMVPKVLGAMSRGKDEVGINGPVTALLTVTRTWEHSAKFECDGFKWRFKTDTFTLN